MKISNSVQAEKKVGIWLEFCKFKHDGDCAAGGWLRVNTLSDIDMTKDSFITPQKHYYINSQTVKEIVNENVTSPPPAADHKDSIMFRSEEDSCICLGNSHIPASTNGSNLQADNSELQHYASWFFSD